MTPSNSARPTAWDVVGVGCNSVDFVNLLPAVPQPQGPNAKMRIRKQIVSCGGQMTTALAACARLGLRAKYLGVTAPLARTAITSVVLRSVSTHRWTITDRRFLT